MIILHCVKKLIWENSKSLEFYGEDCVKAEGFIHCSDIHTFERVAPIFKNVKEELVLLCIDTEKLTSKVKWEDGDNCGTAYPHIYGLLNTNAVIDVLPFLKDNSGNFLLNPELQN